MSQASEREMLIRIDERTKEMHKVMFGNGQPGMVKRLADVEASQDAMKRPKQWPSVVAAVTALVMCIFTIWNNQHKPCESSIHKQPIKEISQ
jgi:hypothetical protein